MILRRINELPPGLRPGRCCSESRSRRRSCSYRKRSFSSHSRKSCSLRRRSCSDHRRRSHSSSCSNSRRSRSSRRLRSRRFRRSFTSRRSRSHRFRVRRSPSDRRRSRSSRRLRGRRSFSGRRSLSGRRFPRRRTVSHCSSSPRRRLSKIRRDHRRPVSCSPISCHSPPRRQSTCSERSRHIVKSCSSKRRPILRRPPVRSCTRSPSPVSCSPVRLSTCSPSPSPVRRPRRLPHCTPPKSISCPKKKPCPPKKKPSCSKSPSPAPRSRRPLRRVAGAAAKAVAVAGARNNSPFSDHCDGFGDNLPPIRRNIRH